MLTALVSASPRAAAVQDTYRYHGHSCALCAALTACSSLCMAPSSPGPNSCRTGCVCTCPLAPGGPCPAIPDPLSPESLAPARRISDPGNSYRTRDDVQGVRRARDPIEHVRHLLMEHGLAEGSDLKKVRSHVSNTPPAAASQKSLQLWS